MGMNYYLHRDHACQCCKRPYEPLHIGKSSIGWCFSLHVIPELGINDLEDWQKLWDEPNATILNEYGEPVRKEMMLKIITERESRESPEDFFKRNPSLASSRYKTVDEFYEFNGAIPGPNKLLRHRIDEFSHCVKHGAGTWDCIEGVFS